MKNNCKRLYLFCTPILNCTIHFIDCYISFNFDYDFKLALHIKKIGTQFYNKFNIIDVFYYQNFNIILLNFNIYIYMYMIM